MRSSLARLALTALMDLLVLAAVVLVAGVVARFFGALSQTPVGRGIAGVVARVRLPLGLPGIKTPYGGTFDTDAAATAVIALVAEWVLSGIRRGT